MPSKNAKILKYYNKGKLLTVKNKFYREFLDELFNLLLKTDISKGDITSKKLFKKKLQVKAVIIAKQPGIIAGVEEITYLLNKYNIKTKIIKKDRGKVKKNNIILELKGNIKEILKLERTILNILQRMSGIATLTNNIVKSSKVKIASTRKTLYSYLDKKAVYIGGALTHRLNLSDGILIKENHLKYAKPCKNAVIEVSNTKQAIKFAKYNPVAIMFDNMSPSTIKKTIKLLPKNIIFEASGVKDIKKYQMVDIISLGLLTKNSTALDMSLKIQ